MLKVGEKAAMLLNEGFITTGLATLIITESMGLDLDETMDKLSFGLYGSVRDMLPRGANNAIGMAAQVWAGAYLATQVFEKGIPIPFTDIEIGGDLPIVTSSEDSLF